MSAYLLSLALGPVQDFIFASRKTRDLWFGSTLLSEASRAAAEALRTNQAELIFPWLPQANGANGAPPAGQAGGDDVPVANKILAIVPDGQSPQDCARAAEAAARSVLTEHLDTVQAGLSGAPIDWQLAAAQVKDFLEVYAAWWPFDGTPEHYQDARIQVERLLAGRKALRDFAPAQGQNGRAKSSLDPSRDTVFLVSGQPVGAGRGLGNSVKRRLRIKGAEQLDGVSLVKRLAAPRRFVSVSRITLDPFIRRLQWDPAVTGVLEQLRQHAASLDAAKINAVEGFAAEPGSDLSQFGAFPFDTQLFYRGESAGEELLPDELRQVEAFFAKADTARRTLEIPELPIYVAVVAADGDRMGKTIGSLPDKEAHKAFSERLATFAAQARTTTVEAQGGFVYSGGDDVLAFLPLDQVLCYAHRLQTEFRQIANASPATPTPTANDLTLSVGVAIGHYHTPLQHLLRWAREAEQAAKGQRNALAVSLHTGSGGETATTVVHSWEEDPVSTRWLHWIDWHRRDAFPDGAAYELRVLERELRPLWGDGTDAALRDLLGREVARILQRKQPEHGNRPLTSDEIKTLMSFVACTLPAEAPPLDSESDPAGGYDADLDKLRTLVNELIIARRIAAVADVALGPWEEGQHVCAITG